MIDRRLEPTSSLGTDDRGVSEVIAFILTFAIILGSVGLLYTTAFGAMTDYQENEQETNAVRAMDSLTDNFNDVLRSSGVNQRYGEIWLRNGQITTSEGGTAVNITITNESGNVKLLGNSSDDRFAGYGNGATAELGEFAYESDNGKIAYEGGGLIRSEGSGSVVLREPQIRCDEERQTAIISLVTISAENRSIQASSGLGITMSVENRSSAVYTGDEVDTVEIAVDTEYETAWDGTGLEGTCGTGDGLDRAVVTIVEVDIEY